MVISKELCHEVLIKYITYYQNLDDSKQSIFIDRLLLFIANKKFLVRNVLLNEETKILIAAIPIMMTFGLDHYLLPHFKTIIVYPQSYLSQLTGNMHQGEVNSEGAIVFSAQHLAQGLIIDNDGYNIGIHEFAHALYMENFISNEDHLFIDPRIIKQFEAQAYPEILKLRNGNNHLLDEYAGQNLMEFFAVGSEFFFERPQDFKNHMPELYDTWCRIYNQDLLK